MLKKTLAWTLFVLSAVGLILFNQRLDDAHLPMSDSAAISYLQNFALYCLCLGSSAFHGYQLSKIYKNESDTYTN